MLPSLHVVTDSMVSLSFRKQGNINTLSAPCYWRMKTGSKLHPSSNTISNGRPIRCTVPAWTRSVALPSVLSTFRQRSCFLSERQSIATISHFFLAIIQHPEVLAKAQREIDAVVGSDRLPTFEDRDSLPYSKVSDHILNVSS